MLEKIEITPMVIADLDEVYEIEKISFSMPWTKQMWMDEMIKSQIANHLVARLDGKILGYAGFWLIIDEAEIVNIAVHPEYRRKGIGNLLLKELLNLAKTKEAKLVTLEVRETNESAKNLYSKSGFQLIAIRKKFYKDTNEDALVYWLNPIEKSDGFN